MKTKKILLSILKYLGVAAFWITLWCLVSFQIDSDIRGIIFPTPLSVLQSLGELCITAQFWRIVATSLLRIVVSIFLSLVVGTLLAILTERSKILKALFSPALAIMKSTPVASFIVVVSLLVLLITKTKDPVPMFITSLIVIPIVWSNVSEGIKAIDKSLLEVTKTYKFSLKQKLLKLYIPSIMPFFMAACRSSLGMAWKAGISAEALSTPSNSIGTELTMSKIGLDAAPVFAWTIVVIILSLIIEKLFVWGLEVLGRRLRVMRKGDRDAGT